MPTIDVVVQSETDLTVRARQVCGMFDCPPQKKQSIRWQAEIPIEDREWSVGLIVGPSGCGKSTIARHLWPDQINKSYDWSAPTIIDAFESGIEETSAALSSVGFNTVPAWLRPYHVLSNGEKFRAEIARRLVDTDQICVIDEYTSVVDRQVAKIVSHSTQKAIRKSGKKLVAVSCHEDIVEWLQPDWTFRPDERMFEWRSVRSRPSIEIELARIPRKAWSLFAPFHYMTAELRKGATCFGLWADGTLAAFAGILHRPHPKAKNIKGASRVVTLPDYQGIGLAHTMMSTLGSAYKALGFRFRNYPAHPAFIRSYRRSEWKMTKAPGRFGRPTHKGTTCPTMNKQRPCAVFEYIGGEMDHIDAERLIHG